MNRLDKDLMGEKHEWGLLALIFFLFLLVNVVTADRYPFPFFDEVVYTDPAINYVMGHGFTATVPGEEHPIFYFYNGPAHSALLIPWLRVFGVSMRAVRSINFVYMTITLLLIWSATKRMGLVSAPGWRLLLVSMLICDYSMICSYRCGRYDCLGMMIVAFTFWSFSLGSLPLRLTAVAIGGAASPWAGLQLLPLEAMLAGTLLGFTLFQYWREVSAFLAGAVTGGLALVRFLRSHGALKYFLKFVSSPTKGFWFIGGLLKGQFRHSNTLPKDFSFPLLLGGALLLAMILYGKRSLRPRSPLVYGLIFVPLLGFTLVLSAHFPTYYGWMAYIPLTVCVCGSLSLVPPDARRFAVALCVLASGVGVGLHVLACVEDWGDRDYSKVQQFVRANLRPDDQAYIDPQVYYPAKLTGAATFFWDPEGHMSSTQKSRLTVCIISPDRIGLLKDFGGDWYNTGQEIIPARTGLFGSNMKWGFLSLPNYRLSVYRRLPTAWSLSARTTE